MLLSDAVTEGETWRSISPLSGRTLERSRSGVGSAAEAFLFISPSNRQRITNDVDLGCGEFPPMLLFCTGASEAPELVAVTMIIGKSAKFKKVPDAIMLKLEPRSARNIACEKREHHMRARL